MIPTAFSAELVLDSSTQDVWQQGSMPDVTISSGTQWPWIATSHDSSSGNILTVNGLPENPPYNKVSLAGFFGGYSRTEADASHNLVTVSESFPATQIFALYGGSAIGSGNAAYNTVVVYSGDVDKVYGGATDQGGSAIENTVILNKGDGGITYGGFADDTGDAIDNYVEMNGGLAESLVGGFSRGGTSEGNSVVVNSGTLYIDHGTGAIYGGWARRGTASRNTVEVFDGQIDVAVYGGSGSESSTENSVTISGGSFSKEVYGGSSSGGDVVGNQVNIFGGSTFTVYGGLGYAGKVDDNVLNISDGEGSWAYAAYIRDNTADGNIVLLTGGSFSNVVGVRANGTGTVTNTVFFASGNHPELSQAFGVYANTGSVENTLMLLSDLNAPSATLYVAYTDHENSLLPQDSDFDARSNKLVIEGVNRIKSLYAFDSLEVHVSDVNNAAAGFAALSVESSVDLSDRKLILSSTDSAFVNPNAGYKIIEVTGEDSSIEVNENTVVEGSGTFTNLVGGFSQDWLDQSNRTSLTTDDLDVSYYATEESKTLSESHLGTIAFINQGAEFIADEGMSAMAASARVGSLVSFAAVHGGSSNYKTGSRVDVDGVTLAAGGVYKFNPNWLLGVFLEAGWAESDSHVRQTKGQGDHDYYGLGLATRYAFVSGLYADGSIRFGSASTEFSGLYLQDSARYDADGMYATAHVGAGYVFRLTNAVDLDVYGRYILTWLEGDDVSLHNRYGDKFEMDDTVTHALRAGFRFTGAITESCGWKLGIAYEHVFDGDAEGAVNGFALDIPSLEGGYAVMEAGVKLKPDAASPWTFDAGIKGYAGDREGVSGNLSVLYAF